MKKLFFNNKEINKQLIITTFSIILTVTLVISTSLAAFTWNDSSEETNKISSGAIGVNLDSTGSLTINDAFPTTSVDAMASEDKYTFTVSNTTSNPVYYSIELVSDEEAVKTDNCTNNQIGLEYINWNMEGNNNVYSIANNNDIVSEGYLASGDTKTMSIRIWLDDKAPNSIIGSHFHGKLILNYKQAEGYTKLSDKILENNPVNINKPDFNTVATTDEGVFEDVDADGETYYFRGAVEDNYVKIGNMDMLWRIVRINGDGTIRLISDEIVGNSEFNTSSDNEKYVGYTYDNSAPNVQDGTSSTIKTYLENWYTENMGEYDNLIASTRYCNDTSVSSTSGSRIDYGATDRLYTNKSPQFTCPNTTKTYGGEYDLKIGLLTADEAAFAGGKQGVSNEDYYLQKGDRYWLGSPSYFGSKTYEFYVSDDGHLANDYVELGYGVVPVLNLRSDVLYSRGEGTIDNPYILSI